MINISNIALKVDELKALFVLGQRVIPFMEELFIFINETSPLLEEVNRTIQENLTKMPNASKQLSKVTQATEMATTEIMDTVDRLNDGLYTVISDLKGLKEIDEQRISAPLIFLKSIADAVKANKDLRPLLQDIYFFIERTQSASQKEYANINNQMVARLQEITDESNTIINALQVQDITAQQLAAVNHLLENIQNRLGSIMKHLTTADSGGEFFDESIKVSKLHRDIAFDPEAVDSIMTHEKRQDSVDAIFTDPNSTVNIEKEADKIANTAASNGAANKPAAPAAPTAFAEGAMEVEDEISQDDIDALFK